MNGDGLRLAPNVCTFRLRGARVSGQVAQRRSAEAVCAGRTVEQRRQGWECHSMRSMNDYPGEKSPQGDSRPKRRACPSVFGIVVDRGCVEDVQLT